MRYVIMIDGPFGDRTILSESSRKLDYDTREQAEEALAQWLQKQPRLKNSNPTIEPSK